MDIFINGKQGAGKTRLAETILSTYRPLYGTRLSQSDILYMHQLYEFKDRVRLLVETIRAARVRAVVFDGCINDGADLLICVQAVKEVREQINADILAVYIQQVTPSVAHVPVPHPVGTMAITPANLGFTTQDVLETPPAGVPAYAAPLHIGMDFGRPELKLEHVQAIVVALVKRGKGLRTKEVLTKHNARTASDLEPCQYEGAFNELRDLWEETGTTVWPWPSNIVPCSDRASLQYLPAVNGVTAEGVRYPLTWDSTKQAFQAADLEADGQVICSAVNVYAFEGALKLGDGKRSKRFMLFELAEVVPVSNLHVAVDKMNTHYFATGTFERRAFNVNNVRPATPSEVLEYLNAKYQYLQNEKV